MWQKNRLFLLTCLLLLAGALTGCSDKAPPTPSAPPHPAGNDGPPVEPPDQPPVKTSEPEVLTATSARGRRIVERVRNLPDIAVEAYAEPGAYRFDAGRSFVVRGVADGLPVEVTFLVMPLVKGPRSAWKVIVNVESPRRRTAGVIMVSREPTAAGRKVGDVWLESRDMQLVWGANQWGVFFDCMIERTSGAVVGCVFTCAWALYATPHCFSVCTGAQIAASVVQCVTRALLHEDVHDARPPLFGND